MPAYRAKSCGGTLDDGDPRLREGLEAGRPVAAMERAWSRDLLDFEERAETYRIYR